MFTATNGCPRCGAPLGPTESRLGCVGCREAVHDGRARTIAVLEQSQVPLPYWDVKRTLARGDAPPVQEATLLSGLASDLRACWGGRGIYGLYRHGLVPGVRDLAAVAAVYLFATERALHYRELWFVLRETGYRVEPESVYYALRRAARQDLVQRRGQRWERPPRRALPAASIRELTCAGGRPFEALIDRTGAQVEAALEARRWRLLQPRPAQPSATA
jgi:hypothetical protein